MAECDLRILEQLSFKAIEASPDASIIINPTGEIIIFNAQAELLFGMAREDVMGEQVEVLLPDTLKEIHVKHRNKYFKDPKIRDMGAGMNLKGKHKDGSLIDVQIRLAHIMVPSSGLYGFSVIRRVEQNDA